ncbi:MAG: nitroreductase family protein [Acidobacteriota bacterium]|nr:nitroreductase family protein [Acidobacteriota bacterium]
MSQEHPKHADPDYPIHDLLAHRWSPYAFEPKAVPEEDLRRCLEAARWAPSSYNEQPWSFLLARRQDEEEFHKMLGCLAEANQKWAQNVSALILTVVRRNFTRDDRPNKAAEHDIGLAAANLSAQATALGLHVHQMIGIQPDHAREVYDIPEGHDAFTAIAIGYAAEGDGADEALRQRDSKPRSRKPLEEWVFSGSWGHRAWPE